MRHLGFDSLMVAQAQSRDDKKLTFKTRGRPCAKADVAVSSVLSSNRAQ